MNLPLTKSIRKTVDRRSDEMFRLLRQLVCIQSGTYNRDGIEAVQNSIASFLDQLGLDAPLIKHTKYGPSLLATCGPSRRAKILLVGHADTVFDSSTKPTFRQRTDRCYGQGVTDMKGGIVVLLYALKTFLELPARSRLHFGVYINSHEEIGPAVDDRLLKQLARQYDLGLVFEACGPSGEVVTSRKGSRDFDFSVQGKSGHAGNSHKQRANAIEELAYQIVALRDYADAQPGLLFNTGVIAGGTRENVIPDQAEAHIDVRFDDPSILARFEAHLQTQVDRPHIPGTKISVTRGGLCPPMVRSIADQKIVSVVQQAGNLSGREIKGEHRGGSSDANLLSHFGLPVIDGLGVRGGGIHSEREYMFTASLAEQVILSTMLLHLLAQNADLFRRAKKAGKKNRPRRPRS